MAASRWFSNPERGKGHADKHARSTHEARLRHAARAPHGIAQGLGVFSIGLGLTELFAPHLITRMLGMEGRETLVRSYGLREIAAGAGLLTADNLSPWMWSRVGGDALDLATLALGMHEDNEQRDNVILAAVAVGGITALDIYCAQELDASRRIENAPDYSSRSGFPTGQAAVRGIASEAASAMRPRFVDNPPKLASRSMEHAR